MSGWIGVDLDGTLAEYHGWKGLHHIGDPIPLMMNRVKKWIAEDRQVKIFTARCAIHEPERSEVIAAIHNWCRKHGLPDLEVTNTKDFAMIELWDDRCVQVRMNTGERVDGET